MFRYCEVKTDMSLYCVTKFNNSLIHFAIKSTIKSSNKFKPLTLKLNRSYLLEGLFTYQGMRMSKITTLSVYPFVFSTFVVAIGSLTGTAQAATKHKSKPTTPVVQVTEISMPQVQQLQECAKVGDNALRLACYDKINTNNQVLVVEDKKAPLDLAKTISTSIETKKATPVLDEPTKLTTIVSKPGADTLTVTASDKTKQILKEVGVTDNDVSAYTPLSVLYDLDKNDPRGVFTLRPHLPTYILPAWYNATPNTDIHSPTRGHYKARYDVDNLDTKLQISVKTKLMQDAFNTNADVWFGYTQQSYWQLYDRHSRPFRSTDYQPEIFFTQPVKANLPFGGRLRMLGAGLVHESNGQDDQLSRSWNRAYIMAGTEFGSLTVVPRLWAIGKDGRNSDNPDIDDYMGYGDVRWLYDLKGNSTVGGVLRLNPSTGKGAVQVDYAYPLTGGMKAYIQLFHGYGENIQDYNHESTNVGVGIMFNDFKGL